MYHVLLISEDDSLSTMVGELAWHSAALFRRIPDSAHVSIDDHANILIYHCTALDDAVCTRLALQTDHFLLLYEPRTPVKSQLGATSGHFIPWFTLVVPTDPALLEFLYKRWKKDDGWLGTVRAD
jgi:hypothetical protein